MDFMIQSIQEVCDFYDVDYYELMKKIGIEHYYGFDKETIWNKGHGPKLTHHMVL